MKSLLAGTSLFMVLLRIEDMEIGKFLLANDRVAVT